MLSISNNAGLITKDIIGNNFGMKDESREGMKGMLMVGILDEEENVLSNVVKYDAD